ncbi:uncharacterized protein LOC131226240 [Magnolia sinica]|uniref:uncharacterized protein LOC131226240 n=1 Tax=Magnolia sinica TaxID=86752 RepID=UPI00265827FC|nr:uncharacterized protein LOC131226240 [Magnolia sinica]
MVVVHAKWSRVLHAFAPGWQWQARVILELTPSFSGALHHCVSCHQLKNDNVMLVASSSWLNIIPAPVDGTSLHESLVYLATVLEYLAAGVLELVGNAARDNKKSCIIPRHLLAVRNDEELGKLLAGVTISSGGVLPNINSVLLPKKSKEASKSPKKN